MCLVHTRAKRKNRAQNYLTDVGPQAGGAADGPVLRLAGPRAEQRLSLTESVDKHVHVLEDFELTQTAAPTTTAVQAKLRAGMGPGKATGGFKSSKGGANVQGGAGSGARAERWQQLGEGRNNSAQPVPGKAHGRWRDSVARIARTNPNPIMSTQI